MIYDKEHYNQVLAVARSYRNDVERLEKQLAITKKALAEKDLKIIELETKLNLKDKGTNV